MGTPKGGRQERANLAEKSVHAPASHVLQLLIDIANVIRYHAADPCIGIHETDGVPATAMEPHGLRSPGPELGDGRAPWEDEIPWRTMKLQVLKGATHVTMRTRGSAITTCRCLTASVSPGLPLQRADKLTHS